MAQSFGVPARAIYPDYGGRRTFNSVLRLRSITGVKSVVIVSQLAHVERALYLARSLGIDAWGFPAREEGPVNPVERLMLVAAALRAWWDVTSVLPAEGAL